MLFYFQGIRFADFVRDVSNTECSDEEKGRAVSAAAFLLAIEAFAGWFFKGKVFNASSLEAEYYEVMELIIGGAGLGLLDEFASTLNQYKVDLCR